MTEIEIDVLTAAYGEKLAFLNALDYEQLDDDTLFAIAAEASSFRKVLLDFADEGYTDLVDKITEPTNALARLAGFVERSLQHLGLSSEAECFNLYPNIVEIAELADVRFDDGECYELATYLDRLDQQADTPVEIAHCFESADQQAQWEAKTAALMAEMVEFLAWVVRRLKQTPDAVPVLLLRDTLLLYFGLKWLKHQGHAIPEPKTLFLSRKFTDAYASDEAIYVKLSSDILYNILHSEPALDLATLRERYVREATQAYPASHAFVRASHDYLDTLELEGKPFIIESGLHGTFPLWLLTLTNNVGDFVLYTTAPWLYTLYKAIVFRKNYNYLRDTETITVHDMLFQLKSLSGGHVIVQETLNPVAQRLARYELYLFKQLVCAMEL